MSNDKKEGVLSLQVVIGSDAMTRAIGPALGQRGINIMEFRNKLDELTKGVEKDTPVPVKVVYKNKKIIEMTVKSPPTSYYLKKLAAIEKGSKAPGKESVCSVKDSDLRNIAKAKMNDMGVWDIESALNMVKGTALSMGIKVE